jgi:D-alanine-D-alanine ligase
MKIGFAYDLKSEMDRDAQFAEDSLEEYDTPETIAAIGGALRRAGHSVVNLGGGRHFVERLLQEHSAGSLDLVFNIAEGHSSRSREAQVPAVCEMLGVPYSHSDPLTLAVSLDKAFTKRVAIGHGLATAPFCLIEKLSDLAPSSLPPFPVIAKPNVEGSSIGIHRESICHDLCALTGRVEKLLMDYHQPVLVEAFLSGAEVTVAVMGNGAGAAVVGAMEIGPRNRQEHPFIYGLEAKRNYLSEIDYHVPPRLSAATLVAIDKLALSTYRALGCRDIARIDLRLDNSNRPYLLEVNPLPGLDPSRSDVPILWERLGRSFDALVATIAQHSAARWGIVSNAAPRGAPD